MKINGTYVKELLNKTLVGSTETYDAYVIHGIENFNLKEIYMASVSSYGSSRRGQFYSTYEEAETESLKILKEMEESWQEEIKELRQKYQVE